MSFSYNADDALAHLPSPQQINPWTVFCKDIAVRFHICLLFLVLILSS